MNADFDFRSFQTDTQKRLAQIYSESTDIDENEPVEIVDETYNKVQRILDCPEMEKSHPYLYSLDLENVSADDRTKIDKIYDLGVQRGVIDNTDDEDGDMDDEDDDSPLCGGPDDALTNQVPTPQDRPEPPMSNFTVLYSGMKDGQVKTGEFYSQSTDIETAKDDCTSSMTAAGYTGIRILAIEQNVCGVNTDVKNEPAGVNYYDVYKEDDSEEFEKQETGDIEDGTKKDDEDSSSDGDSDDKSDEGSDSEGDSDEEGDSDDDDSSDDEDEDKDEGDDDKEDDSSDDDSDDKKDDKKKDDDEEEELPAEQKALYKDEYEKLFKQTLKKLKIDKSVQEMELSQKMEFWTEMSKRWSKADPSRFLSDKEQERLSKIVVKQSEQIA